MTYRLDRPMMVLAFKDNHQAATTIPAGQVVELIGPAKDDRFFVISSVSFRQGCVRPPESGFLLGQEAADRGSADRKPASDFRFADSLPA